jgi:hypothetical protein
VEVDKTILLSAKKRVGSCVQLLIACQNWSNIFCYIMLLIIFFAYNMFNFDVGFHFKIETSHPVYSFNGATWSIVSC